ncbi:hypothetical protein LINPERHAP1_LOCUS25914, partial [Linum perenne]
LFLFPFSLLLFHRHTSEFPFSLLLFLRHTSEFPFSLLFFRRHTSGFPFSLLFFIDTRLNFPSLSSKFVISKFPSLSLSFPPTIFSQIFELTIDLVFILHRFYTLRLDLHTQR